MRWFELGSCGGGGHIAEYYHGKKKSSLHGVFGQVFLMERNDNNECACGILIQGRGLYRYK